MMQFRSGTSDRASHIFDSVSRTRRLLKVWVEATRVPPPLSVSLDEAMVDLATLNLIARDKVPQLILGLRSWLTTIGPWM